ncbi:DNA-binding domain-containing protein [Celeribacter sp.]|uniref:HvfC/BufC N-terminal domain-containing protein n=1 Tax=Celeribacter sp. TaxID=1890673 RepID=UPI003A95AC3E
MTNSAFIAAALDPTAPVPNGIVGADGHPTTKRFNVYRNNIVVGLKDALATGFPAVKSLVGDAFFDAMAGECVRQSPPTSPLMTEFGAAFPAFIATFPPAASLPYLADVARLEWAMRQAYHAADAAPVAADRLTDPEAFFARVTLAPAVQMVRSAYPICDIREAAFGGPAPKGGAQDALITRPEFDPIVTPFPSGTAAVIDALHAGETLGAAIEHAPQSLDLTSFIGALLSGGAITHLEDIA